MENIRELKTKYSCQQTKDAVIGSKREYVKFVARCLDDEEFIKVMNELLPFDNVAQAKLKIVDDASPVKSIGLSIMRMEPESPLFSLGISIEIAGSEENKAVNSKKPAKSAFMVWVRAHKGAFIINDPELRAQLAYCE